MNKRKIIIMVVVVIVVIVVAGLVYFLLLKKDGNQQPVVVNTNTQGVLPGQELPSGGDPGTGEKEPASVVTSKERDQIGLKNTTKFFVAMLGTYSSDAKFQNIIDLKPMMTNQMKIWADDFVTRNLSGLASQDEQITTQVFSVEIVSYSALRTKVLVQTRREKIDAQGQKTYSQEIEVGLVKAASEWLVDEVEWK